MSAVNEERATPRRLSLPGHPPVGLGYRRALHEELLALPEGRLDFLEIAPENYCGIGGKLRRRLSAALARWPVLSHGFSLSVGGSDPLDGELLDALGEFIDATGVPWHSDHLCWSSHGGTHLHDLLPIPFTRENARRTAQRIKDVQSALPVPFAVENVSTYLRHPEDELDEPDFLAEVVERAGCRILLDVNNIYVNSVNFRADAYELLARMPAEEALQIHVAGCYPEEPGLMIDTHGEAIHEPVYPLLEAALARTGPVPILLERDFNFPPLAELLGEVDRLRAVARRVFGPEREARRG